MASQSQMRQFESLQEYREVKHNKIVKEYWRTKGKHSSEHENNTVRGLELKTLDKNDS